MPTYTVKQAAAELNVSASLLYSLVARGRITHERHGVGRGVIRISGDALESYRVTCRRGGMSTAAPPVATVTPPRPRPQHVRMKP